jgi:hypothetical protein
MIYFLNNGHAGFSKTIVSHKRTIGARGSSFCGETFLSANHSWKSLPAIR